MSYDNRPSFLSQPTVLLGGRRPPPPPSPSSIASSFPPAEIYLLLCCPSSWPQVRCQGGLHGVTPSGESGESCVHNKKESPLPVSKLPFLAGHLQPQRTTAPRLPICGGSQQEWEFSWFRIWLPHDSTPEASISWSPWAFLPSSMPGTKPAPARVDGGLERLWPQSLIAG